MGKSSGSGNEGQGWLGSMGPLGESGRVRAGKRPLPLWDFENSSCKERPVTRGDFNKETGGGVEGGNFLCESMQVLGMLCVLQSVTCTFNFSYKQGAYRALCISCVLKMALGHMCFSIGSLTCLIFNLITCIFCNLALRSIVIPAFVSHSPSKEPNKLHGCGYEYRDNLFLVQHSNPYTPHWLYSFLLLFCVPFKGM